MIRAASLLIVSFVGRFSPPRNRRLPPQAYRAASAPRGFGTAARSSAWRFRRTASCWRPAGGNDFVRLWSTEAGTEQPFQGVLEPVPSPFPRGTALSRPRGRIQEDSPVWDPASGKEGPGSPGPSVTPIKALAYSADGDQLASGSSRRRPSSSGKRPAPGNSHVLLKKGHADEITSLAFSPWTARLLASASTDRTLRLWSTANQQMARHMDGGCGVDQRNLQQRR